MSKRQRRKEPRFLCGDCGVDTAAINEWYALKDAVWDQAWPGSRRIMDPATKPDVLCIGCLEVRLGRRLMPGDFSAAPINSLDDDKMSQRLRERLDPTAVIADALRRQ